MIRSICPDHRFTVPLDVKSRRVDYSLSHSPPGPFGLPQPIILNVTAETIFALLSVASCLQRLVSFVTSCQVVFKLRAVLHISSMATGRIQNGESQRCNASLNTQ